MKNLKSIITIFVILFFVTMAQAQKKEALPNAIVFKIEHPTITKPSYLLGTLHLMCEEDFKIPENVTQILKTIDALVLEVNLSDPEEIKVMQESIASSKKISEELSKEQFQELDILVQKVMAVPLSNFDVYGLSTLNSILISKMLPCNKMKFLEMELIQAATQNKIPVHSLEKVADQMEFFKKAYPTDFLFQQLMLFESYKKDFNIAIQAYLKKDLSTAVDRITKEMYMNKNAIQYMLTERNKNWVAKIPEMMKEKSNLFAVGAAHLANKNGIIHLLKQKGYTITPIFK